MRGTELTSELIGTLHQVARPVLLVDPDARVLFANRAAESLLAGRRSLLLEHSHLSAIRSPDSSALHRLIAATALGGAGGSIVICREARASVIVLASPLSAGSDLPLRRAARIAAVFIKDLESPAPLALSCFARHFGLTSAQATLAREIAKGDGVGAAAQRLGISYATARTQLLQIFGKTESRRQGQLIRLMMEWNLEMAAQASTSGRGDSAFGDRAGDIAH